MTQQKTYEFAGFTFKTYFKPAGSGYEIGLMGGNTNYFVGNFVHEKEAKKWWAFFNKSIAGFYRKFEYSAEAPRDFYGKFMGQYLYKEYYQFLGTLFENYNSYYDKSYTKFSKQYDKIMRSFAA